MITVKRIFHFNTIIKLILVIDKKFTLKFSWIKYISKTLVIIISKVFVIIIIITTTVLTFFFAFVG